MIKKPNRLTLVEQVALQMEELIERGHWKIGVKIPSEKELMQTFDVSRNTLREAIRALVHAGLLKSKQGKGTIVQSTSVLSVALNKHMEKSGLLDTLEVRLALEQKAAALAAKRRTEDELDELEKCIDLGVEALNKDNMDQFIQADISFHKTILIMADNRLLYDLYDYMTDSIYESISNILSVDSLASNETRIHKELLEAIRNQDSRKAEAYVNEYITTLKHRVKQLEEEKDV
ncbi:FadR family transcriptional regulator [Cerasibacillus terrae]|uniref:FadR family transcriptional regulator n=1 Tax=Cerasibacillus terrae TaxID=2498845 RepID=A0A5C8NV10_9BACI|nr:FadR family transcriptional regulator [Cerasibacillus terrae]